MSHDTLSRRTINTAGLSALAAALASGAAGGTQSVRPVGGPGAAPPVAAKLQPTSLADAQLALAGHLIGAVAQGGSATSRSKSLPAGPGAPNIVVSPAGIAAALALVGLAGEAAVQKSLQKALQFRSTPKPESDLAAVLAPLRDLGGGPDSPLVVANRVVLDPASKPASKYVDDLKKYKVEIGQESLSDPHTLGEINAWVNRQTRGLVPSILDELPHDGGLVALNALYFKDRWVRPFDKAQTKSAQFHSLGASASKVQMMQQKGSFRFHAKGRFSAADLAFATERFALTIVTTTDKPAAAAELLKGAGTWLDGRDFAEEEGRIAVPRLQIASSSDLLAPMLRLGLPRSLLLSRLSGAPQRIASIKQRATLKLDEQGAEAAAATAITTQRSLERKIAGVTVDKPFLFALRDKKTGYILLAGYMNKLDPATA